MATSPTPTQTETEILALTASRQTQRTIARRVRLSRTIVRKIQRKLGASPCAPNPSRFKPGHSGNPKPTRTSWKKGVSGNPDGSAFLRIPVDATMRKMAREKRLSVQAYLLELHQIYYIDHKAT